MSDEECSYVVYPWNGRRPLRKSCPHQEPFFLSVAGQHYVLAENPENPTHRLELVITPEGKESEAFNNRCLEHCFQWEAERGHAYLCWLGPSRERLSDLCGVTLDDEMLLERVLHMSNVRCCPTIQDAVDEFYAARTRSAMILKEPAVRDELQRTLVEKTRAGRRRR